MTADGPARLLAPRSIAVVGATEREGAYGDTLLRNTLVTDLAPMTPRRALVLPVDPGRDAYLTPFLSGDLDPDPDILTDDHPLVFFAIDRAAVLRLTKAGTQIRIDY